MISSSRPAGSHQGRDGRPGAAKRTREREAAQNGGTRVPLTDADLVLRWAIWDVRRRDLPSDVAAALDRLAPCYPRRDRKPRQRPYTEGRYRLSVFPDRSGDRDLYDSFPVSPGRTLDEALEKDPAYVLIDAL